MSDFVQNIKSECNEENRKAMQVYLEKIRRDKNLDHFYQILGEICDHIYQERLDSDRSRCLLEPFDPEEDMDNIIICICREFVCDAEVAKYIKNLFNDLSDIITILTLAFYQKKGYHYSIIAGNILTCYDHVLTNDQIDILLQNLSMYVERTRDHTTEDIYSFLKNRKTFDFESYEAPYWVSLDEGENISLLQTVSTGVDEEGEESGGFQKFLSENDFVFQMVPNGKGKKKEEEGYYIQNLPERIQSSIDSFLRTSTQTESEEMNVKIGLPNRVWGPTNKIKDRDCVSGPDGKGPCRMLQCECLGIGDSYETEDFVGELTWFHGKCDGCGKHILDPSHALRFPYRQGGWKGCYCCWKCLTEKPPFYIREEESILLSIMKRTIDTFGIMNRSSLD